MPKEREKIEKKSVTVHFNRLSKLHNRLKILYIKISIVKMKFIS